LARKLNFTRGEVRALGSIGETLRIQGEFPKALEMEFEALRISKNIHDTEGEGLSLIYIGLVYVEMGEYRQAINYFQQGNKIHESLPIKRLVSFGLCSIGNVYEKMNMLDSALFFQQKAYAISQQLTYLSLGALIFTRLGIVNARLGNHAQALGYYQAALHNTYISGDMSNRSNSQYRIAELFLSLNQPDSSLHYARLAFVSAQQVSQKKTILDACNLLSKLFKAKSQLDSAFHYQELAMAAKDSLFGPEKFQRLQLLTSTEQLRQQEILQAQAAFKTKIRLYAALAAVGVFLLVAIILYRNNRQKHKANALLRSQKSEIQNTLTELKATQSQLIQSEKMASLGELTAGIAHEIQNPLNFVNNFSEVNKELVEELRQEIEKVKAIAGDIKENEEKINHHGKRADAIVKGMLQHSRKSTGQKEPTDINALADEYLRLSYHGIRAKNKSFNAAMQTHFDESIGKINIIPQDIGRVILNLINNAFYAVDEKKKSTYAEASADKQYEPTVSVSTKKTGNKVLISVKDNGNGIPPKVLDKIFQPFFTTKPTGQGTGLGLSLSYDIVKAHGGELKVETTEEEGTLFIIQLPIS
jgi:signal transduction histidine kinase